MIKTAESVTPMHPDKICDRISDAILDECLRQDPESRVAIETMGGHGIITITGELTTKAYINAREIAQRIAGTEYGVQTNIVHQSPDIARGVDTGGAGDQGIMVGYACDENDAMIPQEQYLARQICQRIYGNFPYDGKTQVTIKDGKIKTVVASFQSVSATTLEQEVLDWLREVDPENRENVEILCNPAGDWDQGGFEADTGLTGRKLMVDNYGPQIPIGGGCFSGKDATKVDRSAAYMARRIAVKYLKEEQIIGEKKIQVWVKLAYAIGKAEPVMATLEIDTEKGHRETDLLATGDWNLEPKYFIKELRLKKPNFEKTAQWGHFGHGFEWEK